ncbi:thioredoxin-like protein [Lactarius hengduanensis]|nr:thioredoxin-like protein [Lactarius pseudohatsudake]KAH9049515.1 thioredoxin-like protein [Lactarius hengduanensis]KAH9176873.1 thioredoxin-like protein [Lactarius sanguifluus]
MLRRGLSLFSALYPSSLASSSSPSPRQLKEMVTKDFVNQTIAQNRVVIFSKSYCPYCKRAKDLFTTAFPGVEVKVLELDIRDDGPEIQGYLLQLTDQRTVPNIFINQKHIGGNDKLQALHKTDEVRALL